MDKKIMKKILVIDDNKDNLTTISAILKNFIPDCTVETSQSGSEGIEKAVSRLPDTIVLDIHMPGMDGFEVCRRIKSDEHTRHIPIIMLTAVRTDSESRVKAMDIGADAFLSKPINETELAAQVNVMLRIKEAEDKLRGEKEVLKKEVRERTEELMEREQQYSRISEAVTAYIYTVHVEKEHPAEIFHSPACVSVTGYTAEEFTANPDMWIQIVHEQDQEAVSAFASDIASCLDMPPIEHRIVRKDGSVRWVRNTPVPHFDSDGNIISYDFLISDITERRQAEEEKINLEIQLRQTQKMEAIGTLAGGIAHDFNNILGVIMGYAELFLDDTAEDSRASRNIKEILKAGGRAKDLVQQILTFSRKTEQEKKPIKIKPIVKEALKFLRASLPATIKINQNIKAESDIVLSDPTQVHQVIMNLCTNASHAMKDRGGVLEVSLSETEICSQDDGVYRYLNPGPYLELTVSDTGHGIQKENLERIFDPYFTTKEKGEGTGLGLSVVLGIVKSVGGEITVFSKPGDGTTFRVLFPLLEAFKTTSEVKETTPIPAGNERILFVDDEQELVEIGKQMLERLGYEMVAGTDPAEALEVFREKPERFDLVITDLTMPNMTGIQLARELRQIRPDIPVILCTGFSEKKDSEKAEDSCVSELVMKPVVKKEMAEKIRKVLTGKSF